MKKLLLLLPILFALFINDADATHNRAGEITYRHMGGFTYMIRVTTYTKKSSKAADRDSLTVEWGDGTSSVLPRINGFFDSQSGNYKGAEIPALLAGSGKYVSILRGLFQKADFERPSQTTAASVPLPTCTLQKRIYA